MVTNCPRFLVRFGALAGMFLLTACALQTGFRTAADIHELQEKAGAPSLKLSNPAGGERWFYATGPAGAQTWRLDIDAAGRVQAREQVLTDAVFQEIRAGDRAEAVLRRIGPGYRKVRFENTRTTAWDYFFQDTWGYYADFSVVFNDEGIVTSKMIQRRDPMDTK